MADTSPLILLVGESHVLPFTGLVAEDGAKAEPRFFRTLAAGDYHDRTGTICAEIAGVLSEFGLVDSAGRASEAAGAPSMRGLVFCAGDIDLHQEVFSQLDQAYDLELPYSTSFPAAPEAPVLPFEMFDARIREIYGPFLRVIAALRAAGIPRICVNALPPRARDDVRASIWTEGKPVPALFRGKATMHANRVLAEGCATAGAAFADSFDDLTEGGFLAPAFDLDGVHLNQSGARIALGRIAGALAKTS